MAADLDGGDLSARRVSMFLLRLNLASRIKIALSKFGSKVIGSFYGRSIFTRLFNA